MATLQNIGALKYRGTDGQWHPLPVVVQGASGGGGGVSTISGKGAPTSTTVGTVNQLYRDENTDKLYVCTSTGNGYTWAEVTADVDGVVKYTEQSLTNAQKAQARTNIGAGTSTFSGSYNDLANKPTIPSVPSWAMAATKPTYTATEVGALPSTTVIPDVSGKVDKQQGTVNAGKILGIGDDGVVTPVENAAISDTQINTAVSSWLTEHPEATTTVADGSVTEAKLSDDVYKKVTGDARHNLTEVAIEWQYHDYNKWDCTSGEQNAARKAVSKPFKTPRYIKIKGSTCKMKFTCGNPSGDGGMRFVNLDSDGNVTSGFCDRDVENGSGAGTYPVKLDDEWYIIDLHEYGRKNAEYMQIGWESGNNKEAIAVYDSYIPEYKHAPDELDTKEYQYDLEPAFRFRGVHSSYSTVSIVGIYRYYPNHTYRFATDYGASGLLENEAKVCYLLDDSIFTQQTTNLINEYAGATVPLIRTTGTTKNETTGLYEHTTPLAADLPGVKWILIVYYGGSAAGYPKGRALKTSELSDTTDATLSSYIDALKDRFDLYTTRFDKAIPRKFGAQLAFMRELNDRGKRFTDLYKTTVSPLGGAKWVLFGDSLTDNYGGHDLTSDYFAARICNEFGMELDNRAKGGSNIYRGGSGNYVSVSGMIKLDEFVAEIDAGTTEQPDYITIAFGTNSFAAQIGTNEDTSETDTSVYGATKRFIEVLREKCPNSVFGFVLSPKQDWGTNDPNNLRAVDAARTAIKTICDEYGVPYIDMSTQSGITVAMLPDGIHISNNQSQNLYYHAMRRFMIGL